MITFVIYMFKAALVLALLTLTYRVTLRRETFHRFNRATLIGIAAVSLAVPAVSFSTSFTSPVNVAFSNAEAWLLTPATVTAGAATSASDGVVGLSDFLPFLLMGFYFAGLAATVVNYALQYTSLVRLFRGSRLSSRPRRRALPTVTHQESRGATDRRRRSPWI